MITIDLGTLEYYDGSINEFINKEGGIVRFEYSLKAIYEWEGRWKKPFLKSQMTSEEAIDFYKKMALDPIDIDFLTPSVIETLKVYIQDQQTATTFTSHESSKGKGSGKSSFHTAEDIYARMVLAGIPLEFENRNFNRLLILLRIISTYNEPPKKMSQQDILRQNQSLNEQRKAMLKTKG